MLDVSRTTLFNAETGESTPGADLLARLAHMYGVEIGSLFSHSTERDTADETHGFQPAEKTSPATNAA